jgi:hypothetical protein
VVSDVPVDDEAPPVTSGTPDLPVLSPSEVLIGCVRVSIGVSERACCERMRCTVSFKKT